MRGSKERKVTIGAVIVVLILVTLFVVLQVPRRVRLLFPTEKTIEQDVKKYLKKRYKQDFHVTNIIPPSYEYASYIITVYPYGKPMDEEHKATVQGWEKDGLITYYDNYALVKLIPELKEYISEIVREEFSENKLDIYFSKEWFDSNLEADITLTEFLTQNSSWKNSLKCQVIVYNDANIKKEEFEEKASRIMETCNNKKIRGSICIYLIYSRKYYINSDEDAGIGECGKDYIYIWSIISDNKKYELHLEDK